MITRLEQAKVEAGKRGAEKEKGRLEHLDTLAKEGTDMATGNYRLNVKTSADMSKRYVRAATRESEGHTQAEGLEKARLYEGLGELSTDINRQERYASQLEKKIAELETAEKEHSDAELSAVINEAREELVNLRNAVQTRKAELGQKKQGAAERDAKIADRWKGYRADQKKAGSNPDTFAAEQVLKARELAGTPSEIRPEELQSAIQKEAGKRHADRIEKHESEIEATEMKFIKELTDKLTTAEPELLNELTAQETFLKGETAEGKAFLASFEEKKRAIDSLDKKTYWFNKAQREQKQNEELKKLRAALKAEVAEIKSKSESVGEKLSNLLTKAWRGLKQEIADSPAQSGVYDEISSNKEEVLMGAHSYGVPNPIYAGDFKSEGARGREYRSEREIRVIKARETLEKLGHKVQDRVHTERQKVDKLRKEKLELPYHWY